MKTLTHFGVNTFVSIPLYFLRWDWTLICLFIITGIFIDIDHLLFFMFKYHKINPKKWIAIAKEMQNKKESALYVCHSPEFNALLLILLLLSFNQVILAIFISNLIHVFLDIFEYYQYHKKFPLKKWSILWSIFLLKNKFSCLALYYRLLHPLVRRNNSD